MSASLTMAVKAKARGWGMDLVGVGNIERWKNCPPMMSPAGLLPTARSVVVCALHHGDSTIEIGGEEHPQTIGPYACQYYMNQHLDRVSFDLARFLEDSGFASVPVAVSNIWRYRGYKDLPAVFAPDMSHIYAAVAAGLAELGYSGLAITPQFGPRQRYVSVVTEAKLAPDPLLPGTTLCDRCGLCVKKCPARALDKELGPEVALEIEGRRFTRAGKNLWRCSWGEHFDLDLDLHIPEKVDEAVIRETAIRHGGRGGEMGQCLKHCLPPDLRTWDRDFSSAPRRRRPHVKASQPLPADKESELLAETLADGDDLVLVAGAAECAAGTIGGAPGAMSAAPGALAPSGQPAGAGFDLAKLLPGASRLVVIAARPLAGTPRRPDLKVRNLADEMQFAIGMRAFFLARRLEELGYDAVAYPSLRVDAVKDFALRKVGFEPAAAAFVVTSAPLGVGRRERPAAMRSVPGELTDWVKELCLSAGADLVGVSSAFRIDSLAPQLRALFENEVLYDVRNKGKRFQSVMPEVTPQKKRIHACGDYLASAKSVIVLGVRIPEGTARRACLPPAEAVGPYAYAHALAHRTLGQAAIRIVRTMRSAGFACVAAADLTGTSSLSCTPRGLYADVFANRFEAVCAGLATIGRGGFPLTASFGPNVRFLAIATDAPLREDALGDLTGLRTKCDAGCRACVEACPITAHRQAASIRIGGKELGFTPVEQARCDWAKRFALIAEEGPRYLGTYAVTVPPPERITPEKLAEAMRKIDPFLQVHLCIAEPCILACPCSGHGS